MELFGGIEKEGDIPSSGVGWKQERHCAGLKKLYTVPNQHISRKPSGSELLSTSVLAKGREFVYNKLTVRSFSVV